MIERFIFLMMLSFAVSATDIQLTWDLPTEREDGSAIVAIDRFNIYQTINNGGSTVLEVAPTGTSYQISDVETGNYTFQISTVEAGQEGALSDPISVNVPLVLTSKPIKMILSIELIE
ncbi:MAG: fibronectin type III domain-containing protein [Gammaproteobacteria bacterium]